MVIIIFCILHLILVREDNLKRTKLDVEELKYGKNEERIYPCSECGKIKMVTHPGLVCKYCIIKPHSIFSEG